MCIGAMTSIIAWNAISSFFQYISLQTLSHYRGQRRKMVLITLVVIMISQAIGSDISVPDSSYKRGVYSHNATLSDIRTGIVLLRSVAKGSKVGVLKI